MIIPIDGAINLRTLAVGDVDDDGITDIIVADDSGALEGRLWILDGLGGLAYDSPRQVRVGADPRAVEVEDVNGDSLVDIVVVGEDVLTVLANVGAGRFIPLSTLTPGEDPSDLVLVDLNGEGSLDIATSNRDGGDVSIFVNDGFGGFTFIVPGIAGASPSAMAAGDLDGDNTADLVITNRDDNNVTVLLGAGP